VVALKCRELPDKKYLENVIRVSQERMHTLKDVYQAGPYFFSEPDYSSPQAVKFREKHPAEMIGMSVVDVSD
jgi:hypothetical protein